MNRVNVAFPLCLVAVTADAVGACVWQIAGSESIRIQDNCLWCQQQGPEKGGRTAAVQ